MCHIVAVNELPTGSMPCMGHSGEVADPEADAGIVLKRLVIKTEKGQDRQCVEPFAVRVGGQAVEKSVVAIPDVCARTAAAYLRHAGHVVLRDLRRRSAVHDAPYNG
jgi:hypothetical protein